MNLTSIKITALGLLILSALPALAEPVPSLPTAGGFSLTPNAGTDFTVGGDFVKSGSQSISNSTVFGATVTGTTTFSVGSKSFNDVYDKPLQLGLSGNYGLSDRDEVSANLRWLHADGKAFSALGVSTAGTINGVAFAGNTAIQGQFSNYDEYGVDAGYKHFFNTSRAALHPYIGGVLGVDRTGDVKLGLSYNGTPIQNGIRFYSSGWTWDAGLQAGFRYDVAPSVALGLETGLRYTGDLKQNTTDINSSAGGLSGVNGGGNRWDIPLVIGLTAKF